MTKGREVKMVVHLKNFRSGFGPRLNVITNERDESGIEISVLNLSADFVWTEKDPKKETCLLLLKGKGEFKFFGESREIERDSLFDQNPFCLLVPAGIDYNIVPGTDMELIRIRTQNDKIFKPVLFTPKNIRVEERSKGLMGNTALRLTKTVFDKANAPANSNLVVGEVVQLPGRWASYPPHHHEQPEIYFYRFLPEQGYGFAQLGDQVLLVKHNDAVKILKGVDHPQVAAPGYAMWWLWVIRHLPDNPYLGFDYDPEHAWLLNPRAKIWRPKRETRR